MKENNKITELELYVEGDSHYFEETEYRIVTRVDDQLSIVSNDKYEVSYWMNVDDLDEPYYAKNDEQLPVIKISCFVYKLNAEDAKKLMFVCLKETLDNLLKQLLSIQNKHCQTDDKKV